MLRVELDALKPRAMLERLKEALGARSLLTAIGLRLKVFIGESFKTNGRGKWRPLAWSTVAQRKGGAASPLRDTGRYQMSWVSESDDQTYVEVGTNLKTASGIPLAPIHEQGTDPYTIEVKNKRTLAAPLGSVIGFINSRRMSGTSKAPGFAVFGPKVNHPGVPARPVLPDQATAERLAAEVLEDALKRALKG